jgi:hypothetical protein
MLPRKMPASGFRDLDDRGEVGELLVGERSVGGAEVHGFALHLLDAAARPDGLIVDLDIGVALREVLYPAGHDWIDEGASGTGDLDGIGLAGRDGQCGDRQQGCGTDFLGHSSSGCWEQR